MQSVGIKKLKNHFSQYLKIVKEGETVTITDRGKNVAYILPVIRKDILEEILPLIDEGLVTWKGGKPKGNPDPPVIKGKQTSEIVIEDRR